MIEQQIRPWEVLDPVVLDLLSVVKREEFVPAEQKLLAFADVCPIPLGSGAAMLEPIDGSAPAGTGAEVTDRVLEIGAGLRYGNSAGSARRVRDPASKSNRHCGHGVPTFRAGIANVAVERWMAFRAGPLRRPE